MTKKTRRSPFPALNVKLRSELAETDTAYCDIPATDDDSKYAQGFLGTKNF